MAETINIDLHFRRRDHGLEPEQAKQLNAWAARARPAGAPPGSLGVLGPQASLVRLSGEHWSSPRRLFAEIIVRYYDLDTREVLAVQMPISAQLSAGVEIALKKLAIDQEQKSNASFFLDRETEPGDSSSVAKMRKAVFHGVGLLQAVGHGWNRWREAQPGAGEFSAPERACFSFSRRTPSHIDSSKACPLALFAFDGRAGIRTIGDISTLSFPEYGFTIPLDDCSLTMFRPDIMHNSWGLEGHLNVTLFAARRHPPTISGQEERGVA